MKVKAIESGKPENIVDKIVDGQTLLFYNSFFANTLKKWNELAASEGEENLSEKARKHWAALRQ